MIDTHKYRTISISISILYARAKNPKLGTPLRLLLGFFSVVISFKLVLFVWNRL